MSTMVYAGSFDPFTNADLDVIRHAADLCGDVRVLVINETGKSDSDRLTHRTCMAHTVKYILNDCGYKDEVHVKLWDKSSEEYCKTFDISYLLYPLNSIYNRYDYDRDTKHTKKHPGLKLVYIRTDGLKSEIVRSQYMSGVDISNYIPNYKFIELDAGLGTPLITTVWGGQI